MSQEELINVGDGGNLRSQRPSFNDSKVEDSVDTNLNVYIGVPSQRVRAQVVCFRHVRSPQARCVCADQVYGCEWYAMLLTESGNAIGEQVTEQRVEACR